MQEGRQPRGAAAGGGRGEPPCLPRRLHKAHYRRGAPGADEAERVAGEHEPWAADRREALVAHCSANPGFRAGLDVFEEEPA